MKISFNEMDKIVRTLPIGYYAKKRIPTKLDHCETSYFDLVSKTITVSYEGVSIALEKVPEARRCSSAPRCQWCRSRKCRPGCRCGG